MLLFCNFEGTRCPCSVNICLALINWYSTAITRKTQWKIGQRFSSLRFWQTKNDEEKKLSCILPLMWENRITAEYFQMQCHLLEGNNACTVEQCTSRKCSTFFPSKLPVVLRQKIVHPKSPHPPGVGGPLLVLNYPKYVLRSNREIFFCDLLIFFEIFVVSRIFWQ